MSVVLTQPTDGCVRSVIILQSQNLHAADIRHEEADFFTLSHIHRHSDHLEHFTSKNTSFFKISFLHLILFLTLVISYFGLIPQNLCILTKSLISENPKANWLVCLCD